MCNWVRGIADVRVNVIDHEVGGNTGAAGPPRRQYWAPPFRARPRRTGRLGDFGHLRGRAAQASAGRRRHGRHPRRGSAVQARQGSRAGHPLAPAAGRVRRGRVGSAAPTSGSAAPRRTAPGCATAGRTAAPAARGSTGTTPASPAAATGAAASAAGSSASGRSATAASRAPTAGTPGRERASRSERLGGQRSRSRRFGRTAAGLPGRDHGDPEVPRHPAPTPERASSRQEPG